MNSCYHCIVHISTRVYRERHSNAHTHTHQTVFHINIPTALSSLRIGGRNQSIILRSLGSYTQTNTHTHIWKPKPKIYTKHTHTPTQNIYKPCYYTHNKTQPTRKPEPYVLSTLEIVSQIRQQTKPTYRSYIIHIYKIN